MSFLTLECYYLEILQGLRVAQAALTERLPWKEEKMRENYNKFFLHVSSSYAKILGETNVQRRRFPKVGQKQKTENNNGQLRIATPPRRTQSRLGQNQSSIW